MGLQSTIDRLLLKLIKNHAESRRLRRRVRRLYGMEIGLYTFGGFDRWRLSAGTKIGRYCSISNSARIVDANHPLDGLSTSPAFYLKSWNFIDRDELDIAPTVLEDDVWLSHNCLLTPGCKHVGRGAVIGAGAVVVKDVPPYAIVAGVPAKVIRYRFPPDVIEAIEETRWWELDRKELSAIARKVPEFIERPTVDNARKFLTALGRPPLATDAPAPAAPVSQAVEVPLS
ncbi:MAG: CatB-related O-acetyltransferase [Sphingobium sp.]